MAGNKRDRFSSLLGTITRTVARLERDQVCCGDLTFQQFETLARVERLPVATVKSLSDDLGIDESTASRNVAVLVRDGYLLKRRHEADRRAVRLVLSEKGKTALTTLRCGEEEILSELFDQLPPDERAPVIRALQLVDAALSRQGAACCAPDVVDRGASPRNQARSGRDR